MTYSDTVAIATIVTSSLLDEFYVMRTSFDLFHSTGFHWFIRCDRGAEAVLSHLPNVHCTVFAEAVDLPSNPMTPEFKAVVSQKVDALEDAWAAGAWAAVMYLDCDFIVVSEIVRPVMEMDAEVVLTPHYFAKWMHNNARSFGSFNSGFIFTRSPNFHRWWRDAIAAEPSRFGDQGVLDDAGRHFSVKSLGEVANIGHWRRPDPWTPPRIPADAMFFHVHLFMPARIYLEHELVQKNFALACLDFLRLSGVPEHQRILEAILERDRSQYYATLLARRFVVVTQCETERAIRAVLMARTLPRQIPVVCTIDGSVDDIRRRLGVTRLPSNLRFVSALPKDYRRWGLENGDLEWLLLTDIDYVFPQGFVYLLWNSRPKLSDVCTVTCPVPYVDAGAKCLLTAAASDILVSETPMSYAIPATKVAMDKLGSQLLPGAEWLASHAMASREAVPGALVRASCFASERIDCASFRSASEAIILHLWHPPDVESRYSGWFWSYLGLDRARLTIDESC